MAPPSAKFPPFSLEYVCSVPLSAASLHKMFDEGGWRAVQKRGAEQLRVWPGRKQRRDPKGGIKAIFGYVCSYFLNMVLYFCISTEYFAMFADKYS
jgi:hypothetical protein